MAGSIIDEIMEKEKRKRKKRIQKRMERERIERKKQLEAERLEKERLDLEKARLDRKARDRVPAFDRRVTDIIEEDRGPGSHDSLPNTFITSREGSRPPAGPSGPTREFPTHYVPGGGAPPSGGGPQQGVSYGDQTQPEMVDLAQLFDKGTKEMISSVFEDAIRNNQPIHIPGLNPNKFKFKDYGYRSLIEHIMEDEDFLNIIIEVEELEGVSMVSLSDRIRARDDPRDKNDDKVLQAESTHRGLEALCDVLYNKETELDPYENEWKHLNSLLGCFAKPEVDGRMRSWSLETEKMRILISANNTGTEWIYRVEKEPR